MGYITLHALKRDIDYLFSRYGQILPHNPLIIQKIHYEQLESAQPTILNCIGIAPDVTVTIDTITRQNLRDGH